MNINRNTIFKNFSWLKDKNKFFIISADYDGLICASFLHHYLGWTLVGYYNMENIWISQQGLDNKKELIWVDLNIVPGLGKSVGGQIANLDNNLPEGLNSSCNLNIINNVTYKKFKNKFPFSTLIFLLWLYNIKVKSTLMSKLFILHSDSSWVKMQRYNKNANDWINLLSDYNWDNLLYNIDSIDYEKAIDQKLYPYLMNIGASTGFSKLKSKHLNIQTRECRFNPDWDEDIILNLFRLFGNKLKWTPPPIPKLIHRIDGNRQKIPLSKVKKLGLSTFLKENNIFCYAIPSPSIFNYTSFSSVKSPVELS